MSWPSGRHAPFEFGGSGHVYIEVKARVLTFSNWRHFTNIIYPNDFPHTDLQSRGHNNIKYQHDKH